jgi:chromosome segregation ATPase
MSETKEVAGLVERLAEILDEDAPNKWVWKTHQSQDEWLRGKILPLLREIRPTLEANDREISDLNESYAATFELMTDLTDKVDEAAREIERLTAERDALQRERAILIATKRDQLAKMDQMLNAAIDREEAAIRSLKQEERK